MRTCVACGTAGQADTATFCFACASPLNADPTCASCGEDLPPAARFCPNCATPIAGAPAAAPAPTATPKGSARKITSVLFGDLVGFTTLSESRDPEEVRELLSEYFNECRAVVSRYGGELEKFIGDAVMAVWGLPVTREDDAERAVRAGLELVEAVTALGDRIGMPGLALRVGITTAEVAVNIGATGQGMVAGDPVNTAARIQSTASPGEVWVDETTRSFASSAISFADAGAHAMKGKAEPVPLWKVRSVVAGVGGDRRDDGLEAQLVGRDGELRLVKEFFHRVQETLRPGLLVVDGEAGVGKSRLGWEFEKYVDGFDATVLWHRGRCLSYGEGVAYYALAEAVRGRLAILAGAVDEVAADSRQLLQRGLAACVPDQSEREWLDPRLAVLLGLDPGAAFPREDLFSAWATFFKYVGLWQAEKPQPVVLVIDDAQYADDGLLAFLEHLLAAADFPVFVLALARPELLTDHPALIGNRRVTVVHLEPLTDAEMTELLGELVSSVPESIRTELVARADGIPLFAIETVRSLIDQNLLVSRDGRLELVDASAVDLSTLTAPASLQALIAARLDTLPADERKVVDRASVLGQVFAAEGIAALCRDVPDLDQAIAGLIRREVFRRESDRLSTDFGDYRFVQGVVRQVAYGTLSRRDRKQTHLTVARAFEAELETRSDAYELAPVIAQHYLDAIDAVPADADAPELARVASDHLERAAERAASLGAPKEAAGHLAKALERSAPERRLTIQSQLAHQLRLAGDHDGATEHATEALKGFEAAGDVVAAAGPAEDLARAAMYGHGDRVQARSVVGDLLERIPDEPDTLRARAALVNTLTGFALSSGETAEHSRRAWQALELAELTGDPLLIATSWNGVGIASVATMPLTGMTFFQRAIELAGEHRALRPRSLALLNLTASVGVQDLGAAVRYGREAVVASTELGEPAVLTFSQSNLAQALQLAGEWDEALALVGLEDVRRFVLVTADILQRKIRHARGETMASAEDTYGQDPEVQEDPVMVAEYTLDRALDAAVAGLPEASSLAVEAARRSRATTTTVLDFWPIWLDASQIVCAQRDGDALAEILGEVDIGQSVPWPVGMAAQRTRIEALLGEHESLSGDEIEQKYTDALAGMRAWGSIVFEAHTCADYGTWLEGQGRGDEAAVLLARAGEVYEQVGARRWLDDLDKRSSTGD